MNEITLDHIRKAAEWAKHSYDNPNPINGELRIYNQGYWDCGTSCCMWGAAHLIAGNGKCVNGPPDEWATTAKHKLVIALLRSGTTIPKQVLSVLDNSDMSGADLRDADLRDADLRDANLRGANLRGANLRGADLSGADLRDADLSDADLRGANLRGADLSGADLRDANLSGANLRGANLRGSDLRGAKITIGNVYCTIK